jgi:hypothetical protein
MFLRLVFAPYFIQQTPNSEFGRKVINFYLEERDTCFSLLPSGENKNALKKALS